MIYMLSLFFFFSSFSSGGVKIKPRCCAALSCNNILHSALSRPGWRMMTRPAFCTLPDYSTTYPVDMTKTDTRNSLRTAFAYAYFFAASNVSGVF